MSKEIKVIKYEQYEATDGKTFESLNEATEWQKHLDNFENLVMLTEKLERTSNIDKAVYILAKTQEDCDSYNAINDEYSYAEQYHICSPGYYMFDDQKDRYVNIDETIRELVELKAKLDKICQN